MPGSTPIYGFPYPLGTDPVRNGDNIIRALAEDVETVISGQGSYVDVVGQTFDNLSVNNGTVTSRYARVGDMVHFYGSLTFGTTTSMTGTVAVALPVNAADGLYFAQSACSYFEPMIGGFYTGIAAHISPSLLAFYALENYLMPYSFLTQVQPGTPASFGVNARISWNHIYKAA